MQTPAPAAPPAARSAPSSAEMYRARQAQREVLGDQMRSLENRRSELVERMKSGNPSAADRAGTEKRISDIDQRIADVDKQIATADAEVSKAAAIPGATVQPPQPRRNGPPEEFYALSALFLVIAVLPMSIALARRVWRRSAAVTVKASTELQERMNSIERAVDAVAVEVERIGEGQRFVTQILANPKQPSRALDERAVAQLGDRLP